MKILRGEDSMLNIERGEIGTGMKKSHAVVPLERLKGGLRNET
jgi:hypothetical protein